MLCFIKMPDAGTKHPAFVCLTGAYMRKSQRIGNWSGELEPLPHRKTAGRQQGLEHRLEGLSLKVLAAPLGEDLPLSRAERPPEVDLFDDTLDLHPLERRIITF